MLDDATLVRIFSFLPQHILLLRNARVCKRWFSVVHNNIQRLTTKIQSCSPLSLLKILQRFPNLRWVNPPIYENTQQFPLFIHALYCFCPKLEQWTNLTLSSTQEAEKLLQRFSSFNEIRFQFGNDSEFEFLQFLKKWHRRVATVQALFLSSNTPLRHLSEILSYFPYIQHLVIEVPEAHFTTPIKSQKMKLCTLRVHTGKPFKGINHLADMVSLHAPTIEVMHLSPCDLLVPTLMKNMEHLTNLRYFGFNVTNSDNVPEEFFEKLKMMCKQITTLISHSAECLMMLQQYFPSATIYFHSFPVLYSLQYLKPPNSMAVGSGMILNKTSQVLDVAVYRSLLEKTVLSLLEDYKADSVLQSLGIGAADFLQLSQPSSITTRTSVNGNAILQRNHDIVYILRTLFPQSILNSFSMYLLLLASNRPIHGLDSRIFNEYELMEYLVECNHLSKKTVLSSLSVIGIPISDSHCLQRILQLCPNVNQIELSDHIKLRTYIKKKCLPSGTSFPNVKSIRFANVNLVTQNLFRLFTNVERLSVLYTETYVQLKKVSFPLFKFLINNQAVATHLREIVFLGDTNKLTEGLIYDFIPGFLRLKQQLLVSRKNLNIVMKGAENTYTS